MIPEYYEFKSSVKIISGKNAMENTPFELSNLGASRPYILADRAMDANGQLKIIMDSLKKANIEVGEVFMDIPQDSSIDVWPQ